MESRFAPDERCVPGRPVLGDELALGISPSACNPMRACDLGHGQQRSDDTTGTTREATFGSGFVGRSIGNHNRRAVRQRSRHICAHRSSWTPPLDALQEWTFRHRHCHGDGLAFGDGLGVGLGDGEKIGVGRMDGTIEGVGSKDGDGDGEGDGLGVGQVPGRNGLGSPLQPCRPPGREYQLRMFPGRALMNRLITLRPTFSPYAVMRPPPPFGAVLPTQTPTTIWGL